MTLIETKVNDIIIASSAYGHGASITNEAEHLATLVCKRFSINPRRLLWIEHYPKDGAVKETFDLVSFEIAGETFTDPEWERLPRETVDALVGERTPVIL